MSKEIQPFAAQVWLKAAAEYFESRPANGEDQEHWASVYNAANARAIVDLIERQSEVIEHLVELFVDTTTVENPEREQVVIAARTLKGRD